MTFSSVLTDYLGEGLAASRPVTPNVAATALAMYFATDTGNLYAWNGATWIGVVTPTTAWNAGTVNSLGTGLSIVGTALGIPTSYLASPPAIGGSSPAAGTFTTLATTGVVTIPAATDNVGRNLFHNYMFRVQQHTGSPWSTTGSYTADRWLLTLTTDTDSVTVPALADADRTAIGDEAATFCLQDVVTGNAAAGAFSWIGQRIEDIYRLSGKTITVSFWAKANTTLNVGVWLQQNFGSGGSPSSAVQVNGQTVAITSSWARYNVQIAVPSVSGKTLGSTANTSFTQIGFGLSSGATNATLLGVAQQSGTFQFWGMQCEVASVVSALEKIDYAQEIINCARFFVSGTVFLETAMQSAVALGYWQVFAVKMRVAPTIAFSGTSLTNCSGLAASQVGTTGYIPNASASGAGLTSFNSSFTATADL